MRLRRWIETLDDPAERAAWGEVVRFVVERCGGGPWVTVLGGYLRTIVAQAPRAEDRRLRWLAALPADGPAAIAAVRAAWAVARNGRTPGVPPTKQYDYVVDLRLHALLRHVNPALTAAALPARMPTGWNAWGAARRGAAAAAVGLKRPRADDASAAAGAGLAAWLDRCSSVVERLVVRVLAETGLAPRDVRRLRYGDPAGGGPALRLKGKGAGERGVAVGAELAELIGQWRSASMRSQTGYLFPHNFRTPVRTGYLTRILGAVIGDPGDEAVAGAVERIQRGDGPPPPPPVDPAP